MKLRLAVLLLILGLCGSSLMSQVIAPQLWNNASVGWNINDKFSWRNSTAYNVLLSNETPWAEITFTSTAVFKFHHFMEASAGVYTARTKQTIELFSYEFRPFIGFRISTGNEKRWQISNLSRLEMRQFIYSDVENDFGFRFRNRTYAAVSLNKPSMAINRNRLILYGYFEAFFSIGQEVRERFFNLFKYKMGLAYRLNDNWGFDLGIIYQDARNNVVLPAQAPTNLITKYIINWGIVYVITSKKNDQK